MDWALAIDRNREGLQRIVAALFAMAELAEGGNAATLPNPIYRAILCILRPAESATRRLVIILARGLAISLPPLRTKTAKSAPASAFVRNGIGTGIWIPPGAGIVAATASTTATQPVPAFALIDPLKAFGASGWHGPAKGVPRICTPGYSEPFPIPAQRVPSLDHTVNAERLCRRLQALKRALDDLPGTGQASRPLAGTAGPRPNHWRKLRLRHITPPRHPPLALPSRLAAGPSRAAYLRSRCHPQRVPHARASGDRAARHVVSRRGGFMTSRKIPQAAHARARPWRGRAWLQPSDARQELVWGKCVDSRYWGITASPLEKERSRRLPNPPPS